MIWLMLTSCYAAGSAECHICTLNYTYWCCFCFNASSTVIYMAVS